MMDYSKDKTYNKVKALYDQAGTPGEKVAAGEALKRIRKRLDEEYGFSPAAEKYHGLHIQPSPKTKFYNPPNGIPDNGFYVLDPVAKVYRGPFDKTMVQFQRLNQEDEIYEHKGNGNWFSTRGTKHIFIKEARFAK